MKDIKLALFDMDGTLLNDRGIFRIAKELGFYDELVKHFKTDNLEFYKKSIEIAKLSKGYTKNQYLKIFRDIAYSKYVEEVIDELKKKGIKTAIATDSYLVFANDLKERLNIDYAFANELIEKNDKFTGELKIHNTDYKKDFISGHIYSICKSCVLEELCKSLDIAVEESIAVGDGIVDASMIKRAGIGIAYNAPEYVQKHADVVTYDMRILLEHI